MKKRLKITGIALWLIILSLVLLAGILIYRENQPPPAAYTSARITRFSGKQEESVLPDDMFVTNLQETLARHLSDADKDTRIAIGDNTTIYELMFCRGYRLTEQQSAVPVDPYPVIVGNRMISFNGVILPLSDELNSHLALWCNYFFENYTIRDAS